MNFSKHQILLNLIYLQFLEGLDVEFCQIALESLIEYLELDKVANADEIREMIFDCAEDYFEIELDLDEESIKYFCLGVLKCQPDFASEDEFLEHLSKENCKADKSHFKQHDENDEDSDDGNESEKPDDSNNKNDCENNNEVELKLEGLSVNGKKMRNKKMTFADLPEIPDDELNNFDANLIP